MLLFHLQNNITYEVSLESLIDMKHAVCCKMSVRCRELVNPLIGKQHLLHCFVFARALPRFFMAFMCLFSVMDEQSPLGDPYS